MESVVRTHSKIDATRQRAKQEEGVRIAVVEDDRMYRNAIEVYLKKVPDSRVVSFDSGEQCFRHYHNVNPDILILDYSLSGQSEGSRMNGLDVLRKVKSMRPKTKVIFLAGQGNIDVATAAMKGGAIDFSEPGTAAFTRDTFEAGREPDFQVDCTRGYLHCDHCARNTFCRR